MSFLDHLEVLRWHLVRSSIAILVFMVLAFSFKSILFDKIILAQKNADFWTYRMLCQFSEWLGKGDLMCMDDIHFSLINITMSGQFTTHIVTSMIAGIILAFPYILFEVWRFIQPALQKSERKYARALVFSGSFLFALGILFGYYFISPLSVQFLGTYKVSELVENQITLTSFISTVTTITLACGLVFQLPLLVYFFTKLGFLTPEFMRKYRKHAVVVTLVLSAIITPPDISSQILLAIPLLILYEISIFVSKMVVKKA
ncbi:MAG: twin-arginine translocase subunit TatC [Vicingus serpentipes]|nr:twin-arginine translocase subunit TatC [Vicingus serpentipes]